MIRKKSIHIAPDCLVEVARGNPVKCRQIRIEQNALAAQGEN